MRGNFTKSALAVFEKYALTASSPRSPVSLDTSCCAHRGRRGGLGGNGDPTTNIQPWTHLVLRLWVGCQRPFQPAASELPGRFCRRIASSQERLLATNRA